MFSVVFGGRGKDIVVIIAIICLTNTFLIATLSRSRLLQKLADRGIAPKVFTKLTSLQKVLGLEKFTNGNANNGNAVANNGNAVANNGNAVANNSANEPVTLPILAIITVSVVTYILTFIKKGAIEALAKITSGFIFFIFTVVNFLVIFQYFTKRTPEEQRIFDEKEKHAPFLRGFPWYSVIGIIITLYYLFSSPYYLSNLK